MITKYALVEWQGMKNGKIQYTTLPINKIVDHDKLKIEENNKYQVYYGSKPYDCILKNLGICYN